MHPQCYFYTTASDLDCTWTRLLGQTTPFSESLPAFFWSKSEKLTHCCSSHFSLVEIPPTVACVIFSRKYSILSRGPCWTSLSTCPVLSEIFVGTVGIGRCFMLFVQGHRVGGTHEWINKKG